MTSAAIGGHISTIEAGKLRTYNPRYRTPLARIQRKLCVLVQCLEKLSLHRLREVSQTAGERAFLFKGLLCACAQRRVGIPITNFLAQTGGGGKFRK